MEPLRIAVIGAGYWGKKVIRETLDIGRTTGRVQVHAVVDNSPSMLSHCQSEFGPLDYRLDYHDLLTDPKLSGVHICSPNASHFEIASDFLKNGKNVLVEKPLTLRSNDAYKLVQLARDNNLVLCTGHIHRFNNGVRELRSALASGVLGDLYYLRFVWTGFLPPQGQREVVTDLAPHPFDICNYLLDMWPDKVTCRGKGYRTRNNEELAFITAEHPGELTAQIEVSWLSREKRREVTVVGSRAEAYLDCSEQKGVLRSSDGSQQISIIPSNTLREEIEHFLTCISSHQNSKPFSNLSDGVLGARVVSVLESARESIRQERTMEVSMPTIGEIPAK
ncbi:MAG TPA: Gfo/Idh/MocA family oxidoreductase [Candidatus Bathyarchaeia archaeon]|nr:Gfo/Idh/MocA family oxidoreductase [Candidatus Bathyarchaeia archaeon]